MQTLTDAIAWLAVWCGDSKPTVVLLTGITAWILAGVILYLRRLVLLEEKWARYFGLAYAVFGLQYFIQAVAGWTERNDIGIGAGWSQSLELASLLSQAVFSPINNLCFLAAARALLDRKRVLPWYWIVVAFLTALFGMGSQTVGHRLPDAFFSFYCLGQLGLAMFKNFSPRRRPGLALTSLLVAGFYGSLNIVYALNPMLAQVWNSLSRRIVAFGQLPLVYSTWYLPILNCLDALIFAIAFVLKLLLFLGALLLIIKLLLTLSPTAARELFREVRDSRTQYLEAEGIVRALGLSVEADLAALYIKLPGRRKPEISQRRWLWVRSVPDEPSIWRFLPTDTYWQTAGALRRTKPDPALRQEEIPILPLPTEDTILGKVMRTGTEIVSHSRGSDPSVKLLTHHTSDDMRALAVVPIRYHGAVIGCLDFEWREPLGYSATALQRIRHAADWLAPAVHTRRQLVALNRLAERFRALEITERDAGGRIELTNLVTEVHDILSPLETSCCIDFGFRTTRVVCNDSGCSSIPLTPPFSGDISDDAISLKSRLSERVEILRAELFVKDPTVNQTNAQGDTGKIVIGEIVLTLSAGRDPEARPALGVDRLHRRTVASLLADAVFDAARRELGSLHNHLQLELNSSAVSTVKPWYDAIQTTAMEAGLTWVVAELPDQQPGLLGALEDQEVVLRHYPERWADVMPFMSLTSPHRGAWHIQPLRLTEARGYLWLGIRRQGFRHEMRFSSPWRTFLDRLSRSADSALVRIERQRLQLATKQLEVVANKVEMSALLLHELRNVTESLSSGADRLEEMLPRAGDPVPLHLRRKVVDLKKSADEFRKLANAILRPIPSDHRKSIRLIEAVEAIRALYEERFRSRDIELTATIGSHLWVAVPIETTYLALSNLILNAADSIRTNGTISVEAELEGDTILCHVTNDGPGIPVHLWESIFELGFTTKPDGSGLGLALARSAMKRQGGELTLAASREGATRFTLHFPRHKET